ncbi:MAG: membrane protein insertase YidC [Rhodospirillales bacterium]|nr:MAG: membrane protein insertase YidC [Rhodospirillales bacterium]
MTDHKNLIIAIVLSIVILLGFDYVYNLLYPPPEVPPEDPSRPMVEDTIPAPRAPATPGVAPTPPGVERPAMAPPGVETRERVLAQVPRIPIRTPSLEGSISLVGARLDDLRLLHYRVTIAPDSPNITLLSPQGTADAYFAELGWDAGGQPITLPGPDAVWQADRDTLTPEAPVVLTWTNDEGLTFRRTIAVDEHYMFRVTQTVENATGEAVTLFPYSLVSRHGTPPTSGFFILHEGPLGVLNGTLREFSYSDLRDRGVISDTTTGGWLGITDKYWLAALIPIQTQTVNTRFVHHLAGATDVYQVDFIGQGIVIAPGASGSWESMVFAGAKVARLLDAYAERYDIVRFDRAIDFGWFYFLTKPLFYVLVWINDYVGNFGVAILILTVLIKLVFFPLANKSYRAMSQMRKLTPEMMKLRERFADDKQRLNQEMMALYKREKVNPASGCLPILVQIPVFFALYKVLFVTIEMRHAPFFGWINDLSVPDPTSIFNLFGLIPWSPPTFLMIGAWPLIMGLTMWLQMKLNPQPPDPLQAKIFMALPVVFTFMLAHFPAGLVIYWTWNNILSILQQWVIMRRMGAIGPGFKPTSS